MLRRVLAVLAMSLGAVAFAASPAVAADPQPVARPAAQAAALLPPWYVTTFQYLRADPAETMTNSCVEGSWQLGQGYYYWGHTFKGANRIIWQDLWLGAGDYKMATCLDPRDGYYTQTTWLDPVNPAWQTISITGPLFVSGNGHYTWGAYLQPLF